jgi:hypothetical protein
VRALVDFMTWPTASPNLNVLHTLHPSHREMFVRDAHQQVEKETPRCSRIALEPTCSKHESREDREDYALPI